MLVFNVTHVAVQWQWLIHSTASATFREAIQIHAILVFDAGKLI